MGAAVRARELAGVGPCLLHGLRHHAAKVSIGALL